MALASAVLPTTEDQVEHEESTGVTVIGDQNWRASLTDGTMTLAELNSAASDHLLPRANSNAKDLTEEIETLVEVLRASGDLSSIPAPVIHAETRRLIDGGNSVLAISSWAHLHSDSTGSSLAVPVKLHHGSIIQATFDAMAEDRRRGVKRTSKDRVTALRSLLAVLVKRKEPLPTGTCMVETFGLQKATALNIRAEYLALAQSVVGADGKRYAASRDFLTAVRDRSDATAAARSSAPKSAESDEDCDEDPNEDAKTASASPASLKDLISDIDLDAAASAEEIGVTLARQLRVFRSAESAAVASGVSLASQVSDGTYAEVKTQLSAVTHIWRNAQRGR